MIRAFYKVFNENNYKILRSFLTNVDVGKVWIKYKQMKQFIVPNKKLCHTIQMANDRPVYIVIDQW